MVPGTQLSQERRARMAAERLLDKMRAELQEANRKLSLHAISLSEEVIEQRTETQQVKSELETVATKVEVAERRLWHSIETIQDGFAVFNKDDVLVAANPAYLTPFEGLTEVQTGISYRSLLKLAAYEGVVDVGDMTRDDWIDHMLWRWHQRRVDPMVVQLWNNVSVKLIDKRSDDGDMVSLALNITDTIRNEAKLKEARHNAEAANRAKSAFLANMTHELRTPMNGVVAMADLLAESDLDDEQRLYIDTIKSSGEALLVLINDVLDYSKIEAKKLTVRPTVFDLEQTVHDVARMLQTTAQQKGIDLMVDYDIFLTRHMEGDPGRVRQVLTNLVGNAIKFTNAGHVLIRVLGLPPVEADKIQKMHITIEDTGIGIPEDKIDHIFGEFNQVEDERNRRYDGTGLGLAITKQLIELMGGEVWVESEVGIGSCFGISVALPLAEGVVEDEAEPPDWLNRVVIADTQPQQREILAKGLIAKGVSVLNAASVEDVNSLKLTESDVLLLTRNLLDGDVIEQVTGLGLAGRVILVSNSLANLPSDQQVVHGQLQQPIQRSTLLRVLNGFDAPDVSRPDQTPTIQPKVDRAFSDPDKEIPVIEENPAASSERRMRILAADDNKTNRFVFGKLIKNLDVELTFATNGLEAVEMFQSIEPDLVFMDISMPEMDGKEATQKIREIEADQGLGHTTVVALTAHAMEGDDKGILAAGLDYYLTKPFVKPAILDRIREEMPKGCLPVFPD